MCSYTVVSMLTLLLPQGRMGRIEVQDQALGVKIASETVDFIDANRVAIMGWSYGGYLSLMAIIQHPSLFKVSSLASLHDVESSL